MINYVKDLETKTKKIEQRVLTDFNMAEWNLNPASKQWSNENKSIIIKLERGESSSFHFLKEKLVQYYV